MSTARFIALTLENARLFRQIRRLEAQYRLVTESLHDAVYLVEPAGYITFANAALVHLTGYARDELLGRLSTDLYTPHLMITDYTMPHLTAEHAATLAIDALCPKPLSLRDLGVATRRVLAQRTTSRVEHQNARGPTKGNV